MTGRRPHNQSADPRALVDVDAVDILNIAAQWRLENTFQREFVLRRAVAQIGEKQTADRGSEQAPTERGRDKRPCHVDIQVAVAPCLSPCRVVGRWQVSAISPAIPREVHAQPCFAAIGWPNRAIP